MKLIGIMAAIAALLLPPLIAGAESSKPVPKVGEEHEIIKSYESSQQTGDKSSGSSRGRNTVLERVIGMREAGLELEYNLPKNSTSEDRARYWQFPARVLKPLSGPMQLINRRELEVRLEGWLKAAGLTRADCERWIFTWNGFRIECDPQTVIKTVEAFDLSSADLREGAPYQEAEARGPGSMARKVTEPSGATFAVTMEIDPDAVRRARADSDVAVGEIMQKPVTLDTALRERTKESVSGTISVTFETDFTGNAWRRTKLTRLEINRPDGWSEGQTRIETVERRLVSALSALP